MSSAALCDVSIVNHGPGGCTIVADHGIADDKGRRVGGIAWISGSGSSWEVRIHATRDGVTFGALRHGTMWTSREEAIGQARRKLTVQGKGFRKTFGGVS